MFVYRLEQIKDFAAVGLKVVVAGFGNLFGQLLP